MTFIFQNSTQNKIFEGLYRYVGRQSAMFYLDLCKLLGDEIEIETKTHVVAHLAREIEGNIIDLLIPDTVKTSDNTKKQQLSDILNTHGIDNDLLEKELELLVQDADEKSKYSKKQKIKDILEIYDIDNDVLERLWLSFTDKGLHKYAHRNSQLPPRYYDSEFKEIIEKFEYLLIELIRIFEEHYEKIFFKRIDEILKKENPNEIDLTILREKIPNTLMALNYFFEKCENPEWLKFKDFIKYFQYPPIIGERALWKASGYLARVAQKIPEKICEIIVEVIPETNNEFIHKDFIEAALKMNAKYAERIAKREEEWINKTKYIGYALPYGYGELINHLCSLGVKDTTLKLVKSLFGITIEGDSEDIEQKRKLDNKLKITAKCEDFIYQKTLRLIHKSLVEIADIQAIELFTNKLIKYIESPIYFHRETIEESDQNFSEEIGNFLVETVRDMAEYCIEIGKKSFEDIYNYFNLKDNVIFIRINLHLLYENPDLAGSLLLENILNKELFDDNECHHEYSRLLERYFGKLNGQQKLVVFDWIESGPCDYETYRRKRRERWNEEATENDFIEYKETWQRDKFVLIEKYLNEEREKKYVDLIDKYGKSLHPTFRFYSDSGFIDERSPKNAEDLLKFTTPQLVEYLNDVDFGERDFWSEPSPEGLRNEITEMVLIDTYQFSKDAKILIDLRFPIYLIGFIRGFNEYFKKSKDDIKGEIKFNWSTVLVLLESISQKHDPDILSQSKRFHEDNDWNWAKKEAIRLIESGLKSNCIFPIPMEFRDIVWRIITTLV
ncbi:MAG: hypothetical protein JW885_16560 [Deltaproteobacteria bacterium]|nr:hypothetical protein [Candidatus Zymogenaceae bacterium]